jgi:hypothetical protein
MPAFDLGQVLAHVHDAEIEIQRRSNVPAAWSMLKAYRFTLQTPACVTVDVIGRVDPSVSGSGVPSAPATNLSTMAAGKIRSPSPISLTS